MFKFLFIVVVKNPPVLVKLVMEAVCIMRNIKPERKPDPTGTGKMVEDYWGPSQKMLSDFKFLDTLKTYDKENINPAIMKKIREKLAFIHPPVYSLVYTCYAHTLGNKMSCPMIGTFLLLFYLLLLLYIFLHLFQ